MNDKFFFEVQCYLTYKVNRISLVLVCTLSICHVIDLKAFGHTCFDLSVII